MTTEPQTNDGACIPAPSVQEAASVWAKIGLLSFGGPAGQIALMHRILVDEKRWISETRFLHALNFCMLLPGPEAQQLATYVGWLLHRIRGGLIAGSLFILPGFVVILALSYLYVFAGQLVVVQGLFAGLKAAVIVIVVQALIRIASRSLRSTSAAVLAILAFLAMFFGQIPFPLVILAAAAVGAFWRHQLSDPISASDHDDGNTRTPSGIASTLRVILILGAAWFAPIGVLAALLGPDDVFTNIAVFFSKMAVVTFGGAYAVLAYVSQEAVVTYQWLSPGEMIDGLAMAESTPGPLIMVTQFVGFVAAFRDAGALSPGLAAFLGSLLTVWVTFVPCFLWIFAGAPYIERLRRNFWLSGALAGITAAVVGVIVSLAAWFAIHALFDEHSTVQFAIGTVDVPSPGSLNLPVALISVMVALLLFQFRASVFVALAVAGALGVAGTAF